jgi:UDP-glucose 4-epimerase/UDP-glucuronate decarboxylase
VRDTGIARYSYAVSKIFGEALVRQVTGSTGLPSLIVRPHNVYGPRMGFDHVIPQMSLRAIRRETPFRVFGAAETRAFCHVDDFCRAVTMLMECGSGGVFHVGTDRETVIGDLARAVMDLAGLEAPVEELPSQEGSPPRRCPDISKLREATGYLPSVTLEKGLEETFLWYRAFAAGNPGVLELAATP